MEAADPSHPQVALAEAALAIAREDQGDADPLPALARVLSDYLFVERGFHGDPRCYSHPDPANSYLDCVIERRTGLPILLALVYLEVGR